MPKADSVHSTPPLNAPAIKLTPGLDWLDVRADATLQDIFRPIARLRRDARDEIDRLIRFLDEPRGTWSSTSPVTMTGKEKTPKLAWLV